MLLTQQCDFPNEIRDLTSHGEVSKTSKLLPLLPFIDKHNVMRVGGRLTNTPIPYAQKYPTIVKSSFNAINYFT